MSNLTDFPSIIQGGMGVAVSNWRLARAVSRLGELGVISGTLLAVVLARRLEAGDPAGDMRRALAEFPARDVAARVLEKYYVPGGKAADAPFTTTAMPTLNSPRDLTELIVASTFVEVFLAKEGHHGKIGMNLLEKLQLATLPSLYGAMLAGVDCILMGAGIPRSVPGVLDCFARGEAAELRIDVSGEGADGNSVTRFDPGTLFQGAAPVLKRPRFFAIVSSATLAATLAKKSNGKVDGFVVEGEAAGGHNAPPRGTLQLSAEGEPVYGPRDLPDLEKIRQLGLPFWIAGAQAAPGRLAEARKLGAQGVQIGTAFAFCDESGVTDDLKKAAIQASRDGSTRVFTDPAASPTGFPFKVMSVTGSVSEPVDYAERSRVCDLGYLREPYKRTDGSVGYRCPAEPVEDFVRKGGTEAETVGRKCLCNGLLATVGLGQQRRDGPELSLVTAGREAKDIARLIPEGQDHYCAADVIRLVRDSSPV